MNGDLCALLARIAQAVARTACLSSARVSMRAPCALINNSAFLMQTNNRKQTHEIESHINIQQVQVLISQATTGQRKSRAREKGKYWIRYNSGICLKRRLP